MIYDEIKGNWMMIYTFEQYKTEFRVTPPYTNEKNICDKSTNSKFKHNLF